MSKENTSVQPLCTQGIQLIKKMTDSTVPRLAVGINMRQLMADYAKLRDTLMSLCKALQELGPSWNGAINQMLGCLVRVEFCVKMLKQSTDFRGFIDTHITCDYPLPTTLFSFTQNMWLLKIILKNIPSTD